MKRWRQLLGNKLWVIPKHFSVFPDLRQAELRLMMTNTVVDQCPFQRQKWLGECVSTTTVLADARDHRRTIHEVSMLVGICHGTCHKILTEDLKMRRVHQSSCPDSWLLTMRQPMLPSWLDGFWPITTWLWCHILPTRPTLHPATFSYFQSCKWSWRGEDFRRWRKFKQSRRPS